MQFVFRDLSIPVSARVAHFPPLKAKRESKNSEEDSSCLRTELLCVNTKKKLFAPAKRLSPS